jgi:hypothetical protein
VEAAGCVRSLHGLRDLRDCFTLNRPAILQFLPVYEHIGSICKQQPPRWDGIAAR